MKKLIIILIAAMCFGAVSAQSRDSYRRDDRRQVTQTRDNHNYNMQRDNNYADNGKYGRNNDRDCQEAYDRMNREYDKRIDGYRNDRSFSTYERDRKIREAEQERQQAIRSFGNGVVTGGVVGLVLGILIGHK
jgi:Ni/Co efflux regulator RcnB